MFAIAPRRRSGRTIFLLYLCAVYIAVLAGMPVVHGLTQTRPTTTPLAAYPTFEQMDRNRDGFIDEAEARALPGLSAATQGTGVRPDAKLDKVRFARALALLDARHQ
jgi:hypothetical protein